MGDGTEPRRKRHVADTTVVVGQQFARPGQLLPHAILAEDQTGLLLERRAKMARASTHARRDIAIRKKGHVPANWYGCVLLARALVTRGTKSYQQSGKV